MGGMLVERVLGYSSSMFVKATRDRTERVRCPIPEGRTNDNIDIVTSKGVGS